MFVFLIRYLTAEYKKGFDTVFSELTRFHALGLTPSHSDLERVMGIEPTSRPWEGRILPVNYTRKSLRRHIISFSGVGSERFRRGLYWDYQGYLPWQHQPIYIRLHKL